MMKWSQKVVGAAVGVVAFTAMGIQPVMADGSLDRIKKQGYVNTAVNQELPYAELKSNGDMVRGEDLTHFYKQIGFVRHLRR